MIAKLYRNTNVAAMALASLLASMTACTPIPQHKERYYVKGGYGDSTSPNGNAPAPQVPTSPSPAPAPVQGKFLIIGIAPELVDYNDPTLPPGLTAADVQKGLEAAQAEVGAIGSTADLCMTTLDAKESAKIVSACFDKAPYDGVVVGNGVRSGSKNFLLFETVINVIHLKSPKAKVGFNQTPKDSVDVVKRMLAKLTPGVPATMPTSGTPSASPAPAAGAGSPPASAALEDPTASENAPAFGKGKFLIIGIAPELVDYTDPSLPVGLTPADVQKGLEAAQAEIAANGSTADLCMITVVAKDSHPIIQNCLKRSSYEGVIIGNGIRSGSKTFTLFEMTINVVSHEAKGSKIGFNQTPKDSAAVATRISETDY